MTNTPDLAALLDRLSRSRFRAQFHLRGPELEYLVTRGPDVLRHHAEEIISARLTPAVPHNDGRQTPWGGHPVFRAQHATATCCRGCLTKNHGIAREAALTPQQQQYVVDVIMAWIDREARAADEGWPPPPGGHKLGGPKHEGRNTPDLPETRIEAAPDPVLRLF